MPRPIFLLILNALYKGFQMRYHLLKKFFGKMVKIKETFSFLLERILIFCHHCRIRVEGNGYGLFAQNQAGMHLDTKFPLGFFYPFCIQMELDICLNPIRPAPVPQRHYHHKIVCQIYMNGLNGLSFHDFSSWILLCPLKKSNLQYLYKIFWKIKFWTYLVSLNFESKMEEFVKKLTYWVRMLTFFTCGLEFVHDRYQQA